MNKLSRTIDKPSRTVIFDSGDYRSIVYKFRSVWVVRVGLRQYPNVAPLETKNPVEFRLKSKAEKYAAAMVEGL